MTGKRTARWLVGAATLLISACVSGCATSDGSAPFSFFGPPGQSEPATEELDQNASPAELAGGNEFD